MADITVYGTDWCQDTTHAREQLQRLKVNYDYVNIENDDRAREWVKQENAGKEIKPTLKIGDEVLSDPSEDELESALRRAHLLN